MFQNKPVLQNVSWHTLVFGLAIAVSINLYLLLQLFTFFNIPQLIALTMLSGGIVSFIGGYILTKRSKYEVCPSTRQLVGSLLDGLLLSGMLVTFLLLLAEVSITAAVYSLVIFGAIEFLILRMFQGRRFTGHHVLGIMLLVTSVYMMGDVLPEGAEYLYIFVGIAVLRELFGRVTRTYLLSPWVNSIWNGAAVFSVTLIALPLIANLEPYQEVGTLLSLPLWVGLMVLFVSISVLFLQLLKKKTIVAKGYLQYKLQTWTLLMMGVALFSVGEISLPIVLPFVAIVVSYMVIEGRILIKH